MMSLLKKMFHNKRLNDNLSEKMLKIRDPNYTENYQPSK